MLEELEAALRDAVAAGAPRDLVREMYDAHGTLRVRLADDDEFALRAALNHCADQLVAWKRWRSRNP
jgi:hypothetical protein